MRCKFLQDGAKNVLTIYSARFTLRSMMHTNTVPKPSLTQFTSERLKALREFHGLSPEAFGKRIGRSPRCIRYWESGTTSPTVRDLEAIATSFGIELGSFFRPTPKRHLTSVK